MDPDRKIGEDQTPLNYRIGDIMMHNPHTATYNTNFNYLFDVFKSNFTVGDEMQAR